MADVVAATKVFDGERTVIYHLTNISDGSGESAVTKVDVSTLNANKNGDACNGVRICKIQAVTQGFAVRLLWDADTDTLITDLPESDVVDFCYDHFGGLGSYGTNATGDIKLTTLGTEASGDTYSIVLTMSKNYAS